MSPEQWGPPIWTLLHTLVERIKDEQFAELGPQLIAFIRRVCKLLPCPDCSRHATTFLDKINYSQVQNKNNLKSVMFTLHNQVNLRKKKQQFLYEDLSARYSLVNPAEAYNKFLQVYNTKGNMKLMVNSFQRQRLLPEFKQWIIANIYAFV